MEDIKYSIAIPAYKKTFLSQCIDSILAQTYSNFEIIIIDDHSPENLEEIIQKYQDKRIVYHKNDIGFGGKNVVGNWNKCLEYAQGDYLICMGDDDMLSPNCLSTYTTLISKYPRLPIYHIRTLIIDENANCIDIQESRPERESVYSMIWHLWHGRRQFIGDWLFQLESLRERGGFFHLPYAWEADHINAFSAAQFHGVANSDNIGFLYRENKLCITKKTDNTLDKLHAIQKAKDWYMEFLKTNPQNDIDIIYHTLLLNSINQHFSRRMAGDLAVAFKKRPLSIFYWIWKSSSVGISFKIFTYAIALAFIKK